MVIMAWTACRNVHTYGRGPVSKNQQKSPVCTFGYVMKAYKTYIHNMHNCERHLNNTISNRICFKYVAGDSKIIWHVFETCLAVNTNMFNKPWL